MKVDTKPIINRLKFDTQVLAAIEEASPQKDTNLDTACTCSSKCQLFKSIPPDEGIMVLMNQPDLEKPHSENGGDNDKSMCTCLKIQSQMDCNLADVHPNIYIPSSLLNYPDHIVKYGGGGSGVTVFGGYHPQLGSLVMKHGGHKDLLELVSLYKIERELLIRGKSKLDSINQSCKDYAYSIKNGSNTNRRSTVSTVVKKIRSQPLMSRVGSLFRIKQEGKLSDGMKRSSTAGRSRITVSTSVDALSTMQQQQSAMDAREESGITVEAIENAIAEMKQRIPSFRMIYISPMHLRERLHELANSTFRASVLNSMNLSFDGLDARTTKMKPSFEDNKGKNLQVSVEKKGRAIRLFGSKNVDSSSIRTRRHFVDVCFGGSYRMLNGNIETEKLNDTVNCCNACAKADQDSENDGYKSLLAFVNQLYHHMQFHNWKVTLAQQRIGTSPDNPLKSAPTASYLLAKGLLRGPLLNKLLDEEIRVIRNLQLLTLPNEVDVLDGVRLEYESMKKRTKSAKSEEERPTAADVSDTANAFVGKAIHKNFHPETGRFVLLKKFGLDLREKMVHLKPKEITPAKHLEKILNDCFDRDGDNIVNCGCDASREGVNSSFRTSSLQDTFDLIDIGDAPDETDPLQGNPLYIHGLDQWQTLLELALSMKSPNATSRIWTCGLTDGGLHNLFLGEDQIWMFDLGEPQLETIPAFLTKFLMSFFHTLGMEEDEHGDWVVRFVDSGKLGLTEETKDMLPRVFHAFNTTTDRLIKELFDGDEEVRLLLLRYVMTQLVSDAAFCIEKWRIKGGGDKERSDHQYFLEKWLWRSLWDLYACEEIRRRYMCKRAMKRQDEYRSFDASALDDINEY